jgi:hypothetical protein
MPCAVSNRLGGKLVMEPDSLVDIAGFFRDSEALMSGYSQQQLMPQNNGFF